MNSPPARIPDELKPADGRFGCGPSKVRPEALARVAESASVIGTSHRQRPVKDLVARIRGGIAELLRRPRRLRGRARQRRHDRLLGRGDRLPGPRAVAAPELRRVLGQVREGDRAAPFLADPIVIEAEPGDAPEPVADPGADALAWAHNETSTGVAVPVRRPDGAGDALVLIDATSGAGGLAARPGAGGRLLLRPAEGLRLRRRPLAGAAEPGRDRADRRARRRRRPLAAGLPLAGDGARELAQGPDLQHAGGRHPAAARRPARVDARLGRARVVRRALARPRRRTSTAGPRRAELRDPVRRRSREALGGRRDDRLRRRDRRRGDRGDPARERDRRHRALPQARAQPAADRDVPGDRARRRRGAHRLHRLDRSRTSTEATR